DNTMLVNVSGLTALDYQTAILQHPLTAGVLVPTQDPLHETLRTQATVFVTDEPSGEFVVIPFYFDLIREYTFKADGSRELVSESMEWGQSELRLLGGNAYSITQDAGNMHVEITPNVFGTPEPGTFALAALGLGAIGLRIRKRRPAI